MRARPWIILGSIAVVVIAGGVSAGTLVHQGNKSLANRTYTAADLTSILKKVQAASGTKGKVFDDAQFKQQLTSSGFSQVLEEPLAQDGLKVTPAECPALLAALPMTNPQIGPSANETESQLVLGDTTVVLATVPSAKVSPSVWSHLATESAAANKACRTFGISFNKGKVLYAIEAAILKVKVTTKAQHSLAFEEALGFPPAGVVFFDVENVQSVEGNLYINATRVTESPAKSPASYRKSLIDYTNEVMRYAANVPS